ncbi:high light inducible protein [Prochlorococcus sp. MIT 1223]|nr:high light inducible protein [Prochlorococcus sp. MIT 1223]
MDKNAMNNSVEPEKLVAERINGWAAMLGFWAAVGAYLTTGQLIPGLV